MAAGGHDQAMSHDDAPTVPPALADLLVPGSAVLLTTQADAGPRTRPVVLRAPAEPGPGRIDVLTGATTRKVGEAAATPGVTLAGPTPTGWFSVEADAEVVSPAPGTSADDAHPVALLRLTAREARAWVVHSPAPFDNTVVEVPVP